MVFENLPPMILLYGQRPPNCLLGAYIVIVSDHIGANVIIFYGPNLFVVFKCFYDLLTLCP